EDLSTILERWRRAEARLASLSTELSEREVGVRLTAHYRTAERIMRTPWISLEHLGAKILIVDSLIDWNGLSLADDPTAEARALCADHPSSAHRPALGL
ncbi:MAG: hypothetical protein AAFW46_07540, partial [Pseudomonadota bacterium]